MPGELPPQPEREPSSEYRLFNLDAMTDEQIIMTGHGYLAECDTLHELGRHAEAVQYVRMATDTLGEDFGRLAKRNPDRAKRIIRNLWESDERNRHVAENNFHLAAYWSRYAATVDYEFAREILLEMRDTTEAGYNAGNDLLRFLTEEQAADFVARLQQMDDDLGL